jgi:hypothetical protein
VTTIQKFGMGIIGLATLTTAILPGRQTAPVIGALGTFVRGTLGTAMGTARPA